MKNSYTDTHSPEEIVENHKRFHAHLDESKSSVKFAKEYLEGLGYKVKNKKRALSKKKPHLTTRGWSSLMMGICHTTRTVIGGA